MTHYLHSTFRRSLCCLMGILLSLPALHAEEQEHYAPLEPADQREQRMKWWRDAKFGMFIHWGLYSGLAGKWKDQDTINEWAQDNLQLSSEEYAAEAIPKFQPKKDFAKEWAELAQEAGCQYAVLTSKHHEGFALFDSKVSEFDAMDVYGRDLVKEYVDAFRDKGIKIGFYHSMIDWHHPSYDYTKKSKLHYPARQKEWLESRNIPRDHADYQEFLKNQVKELMTNYGDISVIWWDYSDGELAGDQGWKAPDLISMVKQYQPNIIMNNRLYTYHGLNNASISPVDLRCGDFVTPEQLVPTEGVKSGKPFDWETCMTTGTSWGYIKNDSAKAVPDIVFKLIYCVNYGGNFLLNANPAEDGSIPENTAKVFRGVGAWMKANGDAVYGTRPSSIMNLPEHILSSQKEDAAYIFVENDPDAPLTETFTLTIPKEYTKATVLANGQPAPIKDGKLILSPELYGKLLAPAIKLEK